MAAFEFAWPLLLMTRTTAPCIIISHSLVVFWLFCLISTDSNPRPGKVRRQVRRQAHGRADWQSSNSGPWPACTVKRRRRRSSRLCVRALPCSLVFFIYFYFFPLFVEFQGPGWGAHIHAFLVSIRRERAGHESRYVYTGSYHVSSHARLTK